MVVLEDPEDLVDQVDLVVLVHMAAVAEEVVPLAAVEVVVLLAAALEVPTEDVSIISSFHVSIS